jgi:N-acetylmuramoyl-L-alanine amidase
MRSTERRGWLTITLLAVSPLLPRPLWGQQPAPQFSVVIDAAHGGSDTGAHLNEKLEEKDLVLDIAVQLRSTLSAHGMLVTTTREMDVNLPSRRRAEIANNRGAAACILLHATASGHGVHLFTSSLPPTAPAKFLPWDTAQSAYVQSSLRLSSQINSALTSAKVPVSLGRTSLLPLDNLTCPAVAVEIAPEGKVGDQPVPLTDPGYQKQVISALTAALEQWRHDWSAQP